MSNPYTIDDLFLTDLPESIDLPELADTPSSVNQFTDGISGGAIKDSELGGILKSTNFVTGTTGFKLTPNSADIPTAVLTGTITQANLNIANRGWTQTSVFSVTDLDTVAWGAGTFTSADGTSYSIGAGNTGNMSARNYIYLDTAVSTTAYQTTTTASTAVGVGKVLVATAINGTVEAEFEVFGGVGGSNINASQIVASSITANEIASSITYTGSIIIDTAGLIRSGQTAYDTGTGWFIGNVSGTPKLSIGIGGSTTKSLTWDGTNLTVNGYVVTSKGTFGGDGSDGALTITSGTTTVSASSATTVIKNYTSISITGTGKLAFSTPATTGTIIFLRSSGAVTLTSSTVPMIDASGMGSAGGAGGSGSVNNSTINGTAGTNTIAWAYGTIKAGSGGTNSSGTGGTTPTFGYYTTIADILLQKYHFAFCGAGGGGASIASGGSASGTGGSGGIGGGGLIIECAGAWNFTTASGISVAGILGTNGTRSSGFIACCGGGGGGGGFFLGLYNTLTANSGTVTVSGGVGGNNNLVSFSGSAAAYGGGGGGSNIAGSNGIVGSGSAGDTTGGGGANGYSLVTQNILYA